MRLRRLTASIGAATAAAVAAFASPMLTGVATAADGQPCGPAWNHATYGKVQNCPDWSPVGKIPVYGHTGSDADLVGHIDPSGSDWYICQLRGSAFPLYDMVNDWYAVTVADNGARGVVPEIFFQGGNNWEADAGLRHC